MNNLFNKKKYNKHHQNLKILEGGLKCHQNMPSHDIQTIEKNFKYEGNENIGYMRIDNTGRHIVTYTLNNNENKILLGEGGIGYVYKGKRTSFFNEKMSEIHIVIKELKVIEANNEKERISLETNKISVCTELKSVIELNHKNIVKYYGYAENNNNNQIMQFMEFIQGKELYEIIINNELSEDEKIDICNQLIDGLNYLHLLGVYHRDIKPENIMIQIKNNTNGTRNLTAKYIDFNFGCKEEITCQYTEYGQGTIILFSPEYIRNALSRIVNKTLYPYYDLWALGLTLYTIIATKSMIELKKDMKENIKTILSLTQDDINNIIDKNIPNTEKYKYIKDNLFSLLKINYLERKIIMLSES